MFGEEDARRAQEFADRLRETDKAAAEINGIDSDDDFHAKTATFLETVYAPLYEDVTNWFRDSIEPVRERVMESLSPDNPIDEDFPDMWEEILETAQSHGPDFEFEELIPSPEDWEQDGYPEGTLDSVARQLSHLGTNPFSDEQRRAMRVYAEELRKRADLISRLAEGGSAT